MLEKLIENWLDSASERTYQPIFCQILMNEGYTVVHSTRHTPQEYGKDVIAIAPDGVACAYQLKGNAKKSLTLNQYRSEVAPQLRELLNQRIENPALPKGSHRSYLVTNGEIEELVQQAIEQENEKNSEDGYPDRRLETITRGQLLSWAKKLDISLWPSELEDTKVFLEIITDGGDRLFPVDRFHVLLTELLCLTGAIDKVPKTEQARRITSAALLTAICLKPFSEKENHWAIITAWSMFSMYLVAFATKYDNAPNINDQLSFAEEIIFKEMKHLLDEVLECPKSLAEGEGLPDCAVYPWRFTLLVSIASIFYLWVNKEDIWPEEDFKKALEDFLPDNQDKLDIWGDAAFPQALFHLWAIEQRDCKLYSDQIEKLLQKCMGEYLPCIYHNAEQVIRHRLSEVLEAFQSPIEEDLENMQGTSWFARQLLLHMVLRDEKEQCVAAWKDFSKVGSAYFVPSSSWEYCLYKSKGGRNMTSIPKDEEQWENLKKVVSARASSIAPELILDKAWLLCLWLLICPQRALPEIVNHTYLSLS
ncbi:MAG: hypothetical protein ACYSTS_15620 [Planctomycetota bacterium]